MEVVAGGGRGELISGSTSAPGSASVLADYSSTAHTLQGGAGADFLYSNNTSGDTLLAGTGNNQSLQAIVGNDSLAAGSNSGVAILAGGGLRQ